jgi:hypothetical protein
VTFRVTNGANEAENQNWMQSVFHPLAQRNAFRRDAVIHVYDEAGAVIETHERKGEFKDLLARAD